MDFTQNLPHTFMGLENVDIGEADVITLPVPFEGSVCFTAGTARGPDAIIRASCIVDHWDEELEWEPGTALKYHTLEALTHRPDESPSDYHQRLENAAAQHKGRDAFFLGLGGDHSITAPILRGLTDTREGLTVVQIDAHPDLLDQFEGSTASHASVMYRLWEEGANLIQIGIRTMEPVERDLEASSDRLQFFCAHTLMNDRGMAAVTERLRALTGPVYFSIDVDGFDPSVVPGTGTPQPGGLGWYQGMEIFRALLLESDADVIGADVVETIPLSEVPVSEMAAAKMAFKVLSYAFYRKRGKAG